MTDYLARYAEAASVSEATAAEVAQFFRLNIVLRYGAQWIVVTDSGAALFATLMDSVMTLTHNTRRQTTTYHPPTNKLIAGLTMLTLGRVSSSFKKK